MIKQESGLWAYLTFLTPFTQVVLEQVDCVYSLHLGAPGVFAPLLFGTSGISLLACFAYNYIELLPGRQWCHCVFLCSVLGLGSTEAKQT